MTENPLSAPPEVRYCCRCSGPLTTRPVAGKPRRVCPACGHAHFVEPKLGVGVLVVENGRLLLVKRGMPPEQGKWSLPAGYVDIGEDPAAVAVRETREETGLKVKVDGLIGVYHNPPRQGGAGVFILYRAARLGGALQAADDADEAAFFSLDKLPELAFASTRAAVQRLRDDGLAQKNPLPL